MLLLKLDAIIEKPYRFSLHNWALRKERGSHATGGKALSQRPACLAVAVSLSQVTDERRRKAMLTLGRFALEFWGCITIAPSPMSDSIYGRRSRHLPG